MLESEVQIAARSAHLEYLGQAALQALTAGATQADLMTSLSTAIETFQARQELLPSFATCNPNAIYDEAPEGLIDLPSAARQFDIAPALLRIWLVIGHIKSYGRLKGSGRGGGQHLLNPVEVSGHLEAPRNRMGGHPRISIADESKSFEDLNRDTVYSELPPGLVDFLSAAKKYGLSVRTLRNWVKSGEPKNHDETPVFTELPEGFIDLRTAAKVYDLRPRTLQDWVSKNHITKQGWLSIPGLLGGRSIVVREEDLREYMKAPRASGRPRKREVSSENHDETPVYSELPSGLINLSSAARKNQISRSTLENWVRKGRLTKLGRLKGSARGGGLVLVKESELMDCLQLPKNKGGRPPISMADECESFQALDRDATDALTAGATQVDLMTSLSSAIETFQARQESLPDYDACNPNPIYDEVPEGLIDLPSAARIFNLSAATLHTWTRKRHIHIYGRLRASAPGGGLLLLKESEIAACIDSPKSKEGRPKVFDELPAGTIDIPSASRKFGIPIPTLHRWMKKGHIKSMGRLKGFSRGGGLHILIEVDIQRVIDNPPKKTGRPKIR